MQPSLRDIVTLLAASLDRELDEPLKLMLADRVRAWRSTLTLRSLEKRPEQLTIFRQSIRVKMEKWEDPCGIPGDCVKWRSVNEVPESMRVFGARMYTGSVDGLNPFRITDTGTAQFLSGGRYSSHTTFVEYTDRRLISGREIPMIRLDWVFDDPIAALTCCDDCTTAWDKPYPVTGDILQSILQYIPEVDFRRKPEENNEVMVNKEETRG